MESIEKLREWSYDVCDCECVKEIQQIADEIEREIAERYMELPLDADGVPIKAFDEIEQGRVAVVANDSGGQYAFIYRGFERGCYLFEWVKADTCHHVKPRTIEDVLEDFIVAFDEWDTFAEIGREKARDELFAKYADELREMGVCDD